MPDPTRVRSMFARISGRYDLLNRVLSLGIDRRWRRRAVLAAGPLEGRLLVDACCGTGDLALVFAGRGARVLGLDFTPEMVALAEPKSRARQLSAAQAVFATGDTLHLPVKSGTVDVASVAFGIRNVADRGAGLREMARVVRPGGRVLVLEFSPPPEGLLGSLYGFYFTRVLPWIGGLISGDREAYRYLPETVSAWPPPLEFQREMEASGLVRCGFRGLTGGIVSLHWGEVPAPGTGAAPQEPAR